MGTGNVQRPMVPTVPGTTVSWFGSVLVEIIQQKICCKHILNHDKSSPWHVSQSPNLPYIDMPAAQTPLESLLLQSPAAVVHNEPRALCEASLPSQAAGA